MPADKSEKLAGVKKDFILIKKIKKRQERENEYKRFDDKQFVSQPFSFKTQLRCRHFNSLHAMSDNRAHPGYGYGTRVLSIT